MKFISRLIQTWLAWVLPRPRLILGIAFLSGLACLYLAVTRLGVETDQLELIASDHPLITLSDRLDPFNYTNGKAELTVVVEAPHPDRALAFLDVLLTRLKQDADHFVKMTVRIDPDLFKRWALLYLDENQIADLGKNLDEHSKIIQGLSREPTLLNFLTLINQEMSSRMVGELFTGFLGDGEEEGKEGGEKPMDMSFLIQTLEGISGSLQGSTSYKSPWASFFKNNSWNLNYEGYFWEANRRYLIFFVYPKREKGSFADSQDAIEILRRHIRHVETVFPDVKAGVTGQEALNGDEMSTALEDMSRATWISLLGVWFLMALFLRSVRRSLIEMVSLGIGLCWTFGFTTLAVGHLNILSIVFAPLLCGLGVDYGIHWFSRFEEEERFGYGDYRSVVRIVMNRSGPGILLAGLSTAFSFFPYILTGFRGLIELGIITGVGTILLLIADFTVLPALAVIALGRSKPSSFRVDPMDHRDLICLSPTQARVILVALVVVCGLSAWNARHVRFDLNPLRLQNPEAESVVWEKILVQNSERSVLSAAVLTHSPEEAEAKSQAMSALPTVSQVETVFSFLPERQEEKIALLHSLASLIPAIEPVVGRPLHPDSEIKSFIDILERIRFKMQEEQAVQWGASRPVVEQLSRARALTGEIIKTLRDAQPVEVLYGLRAYQQNFIGDLKTTWDFLRQGVSTTFMTIDDLPSVIREKFLQNDTYVVRVYPREFIWDEGALTRFVTDVQRVDAEAVGDPVSLFVFASAFKKACILASVYALIAIFILLTLTFKRLSLTLLALVPLVIGTLITVGLMGAMGMHFNLANSIFMPLIVGAGVEYGVVILQRWREGSVEPGHLPMSTGKGVICAALTTTVGFGTLMISHHRGIFSLGLVAFMGSLCVLFCAIVVLPALLAGATQPRSVHVKGVTQP